jgi:phosphatidylglycerol:prolipoprotein diacylglycerol transferase
MKPVLFHLGSFPVYAFPVFLIAAVAVGLSLVPRYARIAGLNPKGSRAIFFWIFLVGWIGSRLLFGIQHPVIALDDPTRMLMPTGREGVWFGGLAGALIAGLWIAKKRKLNFWRLLDTAAMPALFGMAIGRIGCLFAGCCFGRPSRLPWAIAYSDQAQQQFGNGFSGMTMHPVAIYEAVALIAIAAFLGFLSRERHRPGQIGLIWIGMVSAARVGFEMFRGDDIRGFVLGEWFSVSQAIGMLFFMSAVFVFLFRAQSGDRAPVSSPLDPLDH